MEKEKGIEKNSTYFQKKTDLPEIKSAVAEIFRIINDGRTPAMERVIALHIKDIRDAGEEELANELVSELAIDESIAADPDKK